MSKGKFDEVKAKPWNGKDLKGTWELTLKIDGARMLRDSDGNPVSRAGKPLYNLEGVPHEITDAEIYDTNWETSMSLVRTKVNGSPVPMACVYSLAPLDKRLHLGYLENPTAVNLVSLMEAHVANGFEGLILRQGERWLKVKPKDTADVRITGFQGGKGKHEGRMGMLMTSHGNVGTGFSDKDRIWWQMMYDLHGLDWLTTIIIEVEFMVWTKNLIMRHPRFLRIRDDKTNESLGEAYESMFGMPKEQEEQ